MLKICEVEMVMGSALLQNRAAASREWALTSESSVDCAFPTWDELKKTLSVVFLSPNHIYHVHSRFLSCLLRTLIAGMFADPFPEAVTTTVFMDGLRTIVARTEVFRSWLASFEVAVAVALNAEYNFKSAHASWIAPSASTPEGPEPMDHSYAEEQVTALRAEPCYEFPESVLLFAVATPTVARTIPGRDVRWAKRKRRFPVGAGPPAGEDLSSAGPHGGRGQQGLAPKRAVLPNTDRERMPGLLVVEATTKDFENTWNVLIVSGPSGNYVRCTTVERSQALQAHSRDTVTVRLVTSVRVTEAKVPLDLGVKFHHFDSTERCLVLALDPRYDLILGMAWSKTLGATHFSPGGDLASHETTSGCTEWAALLDVGVAEIGTDVVEDLRPVFVPLGTVGHLLGVA
ncbi:LOW QUALITY PROTEIN: hypothetical protein PHMEG_00022974 [Phytophthora megakarya]|uniref:Uncharacterized protein n=1 Tax=Phytophthora megakarya TaxID=4795 RepID=A0A225VI49_9STRA|nr:LOW QUALITY PROTEIN: hypothetical protein PHMEG_00022974 [Phytophthora megakarya]